MLHLPTSWPTWLVWVVFAALLAGLDLAMGMIGAMVVRTRGTDAAPVWAAAGAVVALLLFWTLSSSLTYGDMVQMNVLWIVALLAAVPLANAAVGGGFPERHVLLGLAGMIAMVVVIQWPTGGPHLGPEPPPPTIAEGSP